MLQVSCSFSGIEINKDTTKITKTRTTDDNIINERIDEDEELTCLCVVPVYHFVLVVTNGIHLALHRQTMLVQEAL